MSESVYRRVLGAELDLLAPELRPYFDGGQRVVDGRLHDFLGRRGGFEVRMALTVTDGRLQLRSDRQWLHLTGLRLRIPALATVTVDESWSDGRQHVDVRLHTPLIGDWFRYAGHFTYGYEGTN